MEDFKLYNPELVAFKMSSSLLEEIRTVVFNPESYDESRSLKSRTVATIKHFCQTPFIPQLRQFVVSSYEKWCEINDMEILNYDVPEVWTNYIYKGEFIPNHDHFPSTAAFVIWVNVPYSLEKEAEFVDWGVRKNKLRNGCLEFVYNRSDGRNAVKTISVDKSLEGTLLMFPGNMIHCVYPFYSVDEPRISISGNIVNVHIVNLRD